MILMNGYKMVNGDKMKKTKNFVSLFIIFCIMLCGCGNSDLLDFDEPAFKERYEEITDALYIACKAPLLSSELYVENFDLTYNYIMLEDTLIDISTVHIDKVGNVYKAGYSDFDVKFCGIDISFKQKGSDENESASFLLVLTDGMYNFQETKKGFTDTSMNRNGVAEFVDIFEQMLASEGKKSDFKIDYYSETLDMDYLNEMFSEKCR